MPMSDTDFFLPAQYVHQIADQVTRMGVRLPDWFQRLQRPGPQGELEVPELSFADFRHLVRDALALTGEPAFGLLVGDRLMVSSHGLLGHVALHSQTLRQTVDAIEAYLQLRTSLLTLRQEVHGERLRLVFVEPHPLGDIRLPVTEAIVLTIKNLIDYVTMGSGQVSSAAFPFAEPAHGDLARELFRCALRWDAGWCGLELPVAPLDRPLRSGNAETWLEAVQRCQAEVSRLQRQHSLSARVRRLMLSGPSGFPSLQVTARQLNLSARTLHRKLLDEGTSYRNILEQVRHTLAVEHVQAGRLTMQEIAFLLGYDDQANFRRAFKRWEGVAPTAYRERGGRPAPLASH